ncbi:MULTISPECIES: ABC transporter substrate-binding protein [Desulfobacula]|nr:MULTISPECIES: ABC transporter substrate-binding protein [Desulfobacula]SDU29334.1 iron complex transport system substrate-binding protein [Desulfobacula phenolica]
MLRENNVLKLYGLFLLFFIFFVTGNAIGRQNEITIIDAMGREVTIKQPVNRIAFSGTCIAEALRLIGVWNKVVGRGYMVIPDKHLYPDIEKLTVIAMEPPGPYNINCEKLLELDVDLLITMSFSFEGFKGMNDKIKSRTKVIALDMFQPDTIKKNFEILGKIFNEEKKSMDYLNWSENVMNKIVNKTSKLSLAQRKKYFFKWSFGGFDEIRTLSDKFSGMTKVNEILGGINIAADLNRAWGGILDPEWLIQQDLDIIICQDTILNGYGIGVDNNEVIRSYRKKVMGLSVLASSKAVKNKKVYMISPQFMHSSGFVIYFAYLAKWFHPDLFHDFDPESIHQEYLTRFMDVDYNLKKHGVFVYPYSTDATRFDQ